MCHHGWLFKFKLHKQHFKIWQPAAGVCTGATGLARAVGAGEAAAQAGTLDTVEQHVAVVVMH